MDTRDYELMASRTINLTLNHPNQLLNAALGLTGEAGEFADVIKKVFFQGQGTIESHTDKLVDELGDILWYVSLATTLLGTTVEKVMQRNIRKLMERYPEGFTEAASRERIDVQVPANELLNRDGKGVTIDRRK